MAILSIKSLAWQRIIQCAKHWLLPQHCLTCLTQTSQPVPFCHDCYADLPWLSNPCEQCGLPLEHATSQCGTCLKQPPAFDRLIAIWRYEPPCRKLITALKFHKRLDYAKVFGQLLAEQLTPQHTTNPPKPDVLIPVPLHPKRLRQRGFNQALEIARCISQYHRVPLNTALCHRHKYTPPQIELPADKRRQNVKHAFQAHTDVANKHIGLIDDVVTTGSTVNEIAATLKKAGAKRVDVYCLARAIT